MKKYIGLVVCIVVFMLSFSAAAFVAGDVDGNGRVTAADARTALRFSASIEKADARQIAICDVNGDSRLTAADARTILRMAASLEEIVTKNEEQTFEIKTEQSETVLSAYDIYEKATRFTCEIRTYDNKGTANSIGTGFFISSDGILVTNYHVIDGAASASAILMNGEKYDVLTVLGFDKSKDIALLQTDAENVSFASFGGNVRVGDDVFVLGSTKGYTGTFTQGHVSAVDRVISGLHNGVAYIQMTAPVANGNSGGPVMDNKGNVIAIVAMSHDEAQNMNFAIPVNEIQEIDVSAPEKLSEIKVSNNDFSGSIILSSQGVTVRKGGTALVYAVVTSSEEYNLACKSDNKNVRVFTGRNYGNVNVVYVTAEDDCVAEITVWFDGYEEYSAQLSVTVSGTAPVYYCGIPGAVPDFGVYSGITLAGCDENAENGKSIYSFLYPVDSPVFSSVSVDDCMKGYVELMQDNGYKYVSSSEDNTSIGFINEAEKTAVSFGILQQENGEWYIFVLIYK